MHFFEQVPLASPDPILGLTAAFQSDEKKNKVNLGAGIYKTEDLQTPVLHCVKRAEGDLQSAEKSKEYLPIDGDKLYLDQMGALCFGEPLWKRERERIASFQTVGGTGALKIGGTFLKEEANHPIWISTPTWPNHRGVFSHCGLNVEEYPYYDAERGTAHFEKMTQCLEKLPPGTIILLHASCHNPTGCDLSLEQWSVLCELFKKKRWIPFFDFAYQGFGRGIEEDAAAIRQFLQSDLEMLVAVSNAKNFSLYGERAGSLYIVANSAKSAEKISSRVKQMIRVNYSNPPMHGARIVAHILGTPLLCKEWEKELFCMRERILTMRCQLSKKLVARNLLIDFSQMEKGSGMFAMTGLNANQVGQLKADYGIYMPNDGRINVCGLTMSNLNFVVDSIEAVAKGKC